MQNIKNLFERQTAKLIIDKAISKVKANPEDGMMDLLSYAEKLHVFQDEKFESAKQIIQDPQNKWTRLAKSLICDTHPNVLRMNLLNAGYQAGLYGSKIQRKIRKKLNTNVPWTILFDPTSACNLKCVGCWAAEYGHQLNLSYKEMDNLITQGKEIGTYFYLLTGGEPLTRKRDILKLAEKHHQCAFHIFTNGTLIDEEFCQEVQRLGNLTFALSLEGFEDENDLRRGQGVFQRVSHSMELMKEYGLIFGAAICYTSANYKTVTSDEFLEYIIEKGARLAWYFHYMPVGVDAEPKLMLNPAQRETMIRRIRYLRSEKGNHPIALIDFQNDGQFINGCIAGGKDYLHINANGDVEPCVFIHYSTANIRTHTLKEALAQPLFMAYRARQPFNSNHFRPCPMLENPEILRKMVKESGAKSTDLIQEESVEHLCSKCDLYAAQWKNKSEELWEIYGNHTETEDFMKKIS